MTEKSETVIDNKKTSIVTNEQAKNKTKEAEIEKQKANEKITYSTENSNLVDKSDAINERENALIAANELAKANREEARLKREQAQIEKQNLIKQNQLEARKRAEEKRQSSNENK